MLRVRLFVPTVAGVLAGTFAGALMAADTPADAYRKGCGNCHVSERVILRRIPKTADSDRRAWIEKFMTQHPNERDDLAPLIVEYLLERSQP